MYSIAVHGLVFLNHKAESVTSEQLAENICTNPARVRKVMTKLKRAGLVETREGHVGGYSFHKKPEDVTLAEVGRAMECVFVDTNWKSGDTDMNCLICSGMAGVMDDIYHQLNERCYQKLEAITIADIDDIIFRK